jgi:cytochrome c oxidase subunit 2
MLLAQIPVFDPKSEQAKGISDLFIITLLIGAGIILLVSVLVVVAMWKFHQKNQDHGPGQERAEPEQIQGNRKWEIAWTIAPAVLLAALFIPTLIVMGASDPGVGGALGQPDVEITGHQFWWEYRYPKEGITSAGELHLPVGQKMLAKVESADVIHDFWVPQLGRKMDAIPGKPNMLWFEADQTGLLKGACSEYCGAEHAWMLIKVIVQPENEFQAWEQAQKQVPAAPPAASPAAQGKELFNQFSCASCHAIAGTGATAQVGPDLTHVSGRSVLGSGILENTPENLARWIKDAPSIKPGVRMPGYQQLREDQLQDLVAYLEGLK